MLFIEAESTKRSMYTERYFVSAGGHRAFVQWAAGRVGLSRHYSGQDGGVSGSLKSGDIAWGEGRKAQRSWGQVPRGTYVKGRPSF